MKCGTPTCLRLAISRLRFFAGEPPERLQSFICQSRDGSVLVFCEVCSAALFANPVTLGRLLLKYWARVEAGARACGEEPKPPCCWRAGFFPCETDPDHDLQILTGGGHLVAKALVTAPLADPSGNPETN